MLNCLRNSHSPRYITESARYLDDDIPMYTEIKFLKIRTCGSGGGFIAGGIMVLSNTRMPISMYF